MKKSITFLFLLLLSLSAQNRYVDSLFNPTLTHQNEVYATAQALNSPYTGEASTHSENLVMDIYEPSGDTLSKRPVLLVAHGGAFVSGSRENEDMVAFCKIFASKGYVTATFEYRMGMNPASSASAERAVYRAIQDGRAAVRFIKSKAEELRIDTNNVFLLGSSAGAFIALHNVFMNQESERPASSYAISHFPPTLDDGPDLGGLDAVASQLHYAARAKAIVSLWGALKDTVLIQPQDGGIPVFLVHGTDDQIVPFGVGSPFNISSFPATYGSKPISERMSHLGMEFETYFVQGAGHEFYGVFNGNWNPAPNAYWDTVVTKTTDFLWRQHKPTASFTYEISDDTVRFEAAEEGVSQWLWNFGDGTSGEGKTTLHVYSANGNYKVTLKVLNEIQSWDTASAFVNIAVVGVKGNPNPPQEFALLANYPNPFGEGVNRPVTNIKFSLPENGKVSLTVYNLLGEKVKTLVSGTLSGGFHEARFDGSNLPAGIYFYTLRFGKFTKTGKMLLIK